MAAVFGNPQAQNPQYQNLAAIMAGLGNQIPGAAKPPATYPAAPAAPMVGDSSAVNMDKGGAGVAFGGQLPVAQAMSQPPQTGGVFSVSEAAPTAAPTAPAAAPYSGPIFKPGQTLTADQLPDWQRWRDAGMPGTSAAQLPPATSDAAAPVAAPSVGSQGYGSTVVNDPNSPLQGLPGITQTSVDYSTLPGLDTDFSAMGDRVRNAMFQRTSGLLNPEHERARAATASRLANQGIVEGSERWNEEMDRLDQQRSLSLERAGLDADMAAGDELGRLFGQALAARQQLGGERERGADRTFGQSLGIRSQFANERLDQGRTDASIAAANAQAGATASGHALQAAQAAAANDIARGRLGLEQDEQAFSQWLRAGQFARGGVNTPQFGTPIPLDVTGAAGVAQQGANAQAGADAARNAGYWGLAAQLLGPMLGSGKGAGGKIGY